METDHSLSIKLLKRQIKNYLIELDRITPFREITAIQEVQKRIDQLSNTLLLLEGITHKPFIDDYKVMEYLDMVFKNDRIEFERIISTEDERIKNVIELCVNHNQYGRAIKFANPEHFNKVRTVLIKSL